MEHCGPPLALPCPAHGYLVLGFIQHEPARLPGLHEGSLLVQRPLVGPAGSGGASAPSASPRQNPFPRKGPPHPPPTVPHACLFSLSDIWNWLYNVLVLLRPPCFPLDGVEVLLVSLSRLRLRVEPTPLS